MRKSFFDFQFTFNNVQYSVDGLTLQRANGFDVFVDVAAYWSDAAQDWELLTDPKMFAMLTSLLEESNDFKEYVEHGI